jgi:diguanylate cyclase (GGDEF)-like protein/PAS domain S-box-containing protein
MPRLLDAVVDITEVADALKDGLYVTDRDRRVVFWNKAAERISGFPAEEVVGHRCADNVLAHVDAEGVPLCLAGCPLTATIEDRQRREMTVFLHHKLGHRVPVSVRAQAVVDVSGAVVGALEVFSDESPLDALRAKVAELESLALIDPLTQVPNRRYLASELVAQFAMMERTAMPFGIVFLDIDKFKRFNDEHGHEVGDAALKTVARTLSATVRSHDSVGRWGGEEFLAVLPNIQPIGLRALSHRLCRMVRQSRVPTGSVTLAVTVSGGATLALPTDTPATIIERVDALMYASKRAGGDGISM